MKYFIRKVNRFIYEILFIICIFLFKLILIKYVTNIYIILLCIIIIIIYYY